MGLKLLLSQPCHYASHTLAQDDPDDSDDSDGGCVDGLGMAEAEAQ